MKHVAFCLYIVCVLSTVALAKDTINKVEVDPIFGEKVVLCEIDFQPDSDILSEKAKGILDGVVSQLQTIDTTTRTIRIEGFPGLSDSDVELARLSLNRALVVEEYFNQHHDASFERFLTGHKNQGPDCQVKILVYESIWQSDTSEVHVASKGGGDGSS